MSSKKAKQAACQLMTETQRTELDRRMAEHETNPDDVVPWEEIKTSMTERLKLMVGILR